MKKRSHSHHHQQRTWAELCCLGCSSIQLFWARVVMRKWLNIGSSQSDYSADPEDEDDDADYDQDDPQNYLQNEVWGRQSPFMDGTGVDAPPESNDFVPRLRKQKSSTYRSQYINTKELRVCAATWNVGGRLPPDDLDIDEWLGVDEPADIYVLGLQELVPLNPGNIFGAEDTRPVSKWENIIREALNRVQPSVTKTKCFSDPPSPSKFKPSDDGPDIEEEILFESDSDIGEEVHPLDESQNIPDGSTTSKIMNTSLLDSDITDSANSSVPIVTDYRRQYTFPKKFDWPQSPSENWDASISQKTKKLTRMLSGSERIGLSWPEPPLHLVSQRVLERPTSFKSFKSFKSLKSFKTYNAFKSIMDEMPGMGLLPEIDLEALIKRKRRSPYVRIVSKQMVGVFITVWVRRSLRKHVHNLKVSTVGVGIMGYIGNKGSVSVSMSIYQTLFCFICTHLTSGEKEGDELKRNYDVHEILRRTHFHSPSYVGLPKGILDHERIIWLGDLNYRLNLSDVETKALISKKQWSKLAEKDQLMREIENGAFVGWSEGVLNFPPTYKYEVNSDKYYGNDPKAPKRTPAWCDRVLSYGKGLKLQSYRRTELKLSDHRPVTATYIVEVELFSPRKLQRALTFTNAEIENEEAIKHLVSWK
ncbi:type IV inositol polyphosphate 5-phosphatase 3 isoform X4 [Lathyrus oleraceus]|nr:type IV inositol polyphosphate 5-phosphatase 3-like isoform X4 [Pisum sativum]KAI5444108.1 Type IV inositol polyphosphate 5-phosphatase 3, variant 3 [Pisum sativum]